MSRYVDISAELLLSICQEGAILTSPGKRAAICVRGVSEQATVTFVEAFPNKRVRVHFNDPEQSDGDEPAQWEHYRGYGHAD